MKRWLLRLGTCCFLATLLSSSTAQDTTEELLEMATPQWLSAREKSYYQSGIRIEQVREDSGPKDAETNRTRQSRDVFASGDLKLIRIIVLDPEIPLEESEPTWDGDHVLMTRSTAQNAKYGFRVSQDGPANDSRDLWRITDQIVWPEKPKWRWLHDPLPAVAPVESTLMRGLALDPRLGVGNSDTPLETIFQRLSDRGVDGNVTHRVGTDGRRVVQVNWINIVDEVTPTFAELGAVRTRISVRVDLLPDQAWQLLYYEMRAEYLDNHQQEVGAHTRTSEIDYAPQSSAGSYRVTDTEESERGSSKMVRFIRNLTEPEKTNLRTLCYMSGFQLPEPEGLPADRQWWQYLIGFGAIAILIAMGIRWYKNRQP